jgi:hypothetical protein
MLLEGYRKGNAAQISNSCARSGAAVQAPGCTLRETSSQGGVVIQLWNYGNSRSYASAEAAIL